MNLQVAKQKEDNFLMILLSKDNIVVKVNDNKSGKNKLRKLKFK